MKSRLADRRGQKFRVALLIQWRWASSNMVKTTDDHKVQGIANRKPECMRTQWGSGTYSGNVAATEHCLPKQKEFPYPSQIEAVNFPQVASSYYKSYKGDGSHRSDSDAPKAPWTTIARP